MANVNLKTDFKNGEKLFDHQLNNNFAAIQAALAAMNKIVWQDEQEVPDSILAFRGTTEELMNREIIDGQLLYDVNTGETYIDYEGERISTGSGNAIHIGEDEPTNASTQLWIPTDDFISVGTEVVDSLEGNETYKAPSVAAVKSRFSTRTLEDITSQCTFVNCTYTAGKIFVDRINKILYFQVAFTGTTTNDWIKVINVPSDILPITVKDDGVPINSTPYWIYGAKHEIAGEVTQGKLHVLSGFTLIQ